MQGRIELEEKTKSDIERLYVSSMPSFVQAWYHNLVGRGLTMKTCSVYLKIVRLFLHYSHLSENSKITDITPEMVTTYFANLQYKELSDGTKKEISDSYKYTTWYALNDLFTYHYKVGNIKNNFMEVAKPKVHLEPKKVKKQLNEDDFKKMLNYAPGKTLRMRDRNRAILAMFMTTGMRKSALCQMNIEDIDLKAKKIVIVDKGKKKHTYDIGPILNKYLVFWLHYRQQYDIDSDALFINSEGNRITEGNVYKMVREDTMRALGEPLSPHRIRAGYCTLLYEKTHDIEVELLGRHLL